MNENKSDKNEASEAWDQVSKAMNEATKLYLQELETYLEWAGSVRRTMLEQAMTAREQFARMGETQLAFLTRLQQSIPSFGMIPFWTPTGSTADARPKGAA